jgi:hypothetical protein
MDDEENSQEKIGGSEQEPTRETSQKSPIEAERTEQPDQDQRNLGFWRMVAPG